MLHHFHPCTFVPRFPFSPFPPLHFGAAFSVLAISTPATWCRVFRSRLFRSRLFSVPGPRRSTTTVLSNRRRINADNDVSRERSIAWSRKIRQQAIRRAPPNGFAVVLRVRRRRVRLQSWIQLQDVNTVERGFRLGGEHHIQLRLYSDKCCESCRPNYMLHSYLCCRSERCDCVVIVVQSINQSVYSEMVAKWLNS